MAKPPRRPAQAVSVTPSSGVAARPSAKTGRASSPHAEALALYEQAIRLLQQHNFTKAAELFGHLTAVYPSERDLVERSGLYLAICFRHLAPLTSDPIDNRERLYAATLALNAGDLDRAAHYLDRIRMDEPANDQALYMLAVIHAARREPELAIRYLSQAIEANPENRSLARVDPDLDVLRGAAGLSALLS
jgi:outer membrane protein assembly factor BamD (BamD/ComL family)